jgi:hypothetical protein
MMTISYLKLDSICLLDDLDEVKWDYKLGIGGKTIRKNLLEFVDHTKRMCLHEAELRSGFFLTASSHTLPSHPPPTSTMASASQRQNGCDVVLPTLDVFIQALNIAKDACGIPPAQIALGSASTLLTVIRVSFLLCEDGTLNHVRLGYYG